MCDERPPAETWGQGRHEAASSSGQGTCDAWEDDEPAEDFQPAPDWDPLWDAFEPYNRHEEPEPDRSDFWPEPGDEGF